jgi:hypothetical protein
MDGERELDLIDRTADVILLSRESIANGLEALRAAGASASGPTSSTRPASSCRVAGSSTSPRAAPEAVAAG